MAHSRLGKVVVLAVLAIACDRPAPPSLQRPWADANLEPVTVAGVTLRARRFDATTGEERVPLGIVPSGDLWFETVVEGDDTGHVAITVADDTTTAPCEATGSARWQRCRFNLAPSEKARSLSIRRSGSTEGRVVVSAPLVRSGPPSTSLVIVVLTDTLRADCLTTYRPGMSLGMEIDRLARDGVVFERAISSSSWTRTAIATLFTGLDAATHAVLERDDKLPTGLDGLPQELRRAGYETLAWSSNPNVLPLWGFDVGFDAFADAGATAWPKDKADASVVLGAVRATLAARPSAPAFLYVHLMDPHAPYRPEPADLDAVEKDGTLGATFPGTASNAGAQSDYRAYLAEIRGMDRELGAFFDDLRTRHLYDDAIILVLADHGEEFLDHGGMRHGKTLYQEMLHVPVVLKLAHGALAGTRVAAPVGMADLAPTVLGMLGLPPLPSADGRNLWDASIQRLRDESAPQSALLKMDTHHKAALVDETRKLILDYRATEQLFDLSVDPREQRDLLPGAGTEAASLRNALDARIARHEAGWHVRVCGADRTERLRFRLEVPGIARGALLEDGDTLQELATHDGRTELRAEFNLSPRPSERVLRNGVWKGLRADEDEIVVTSGESDRLVVHTIGDTRVSFAAGTSDAAAPATEFTAQASTAAFQIRPSDDVRCRQQPAADAILPPPAPDPYVRVWYVVPSEQVGANQVDPTMQERLRALGYQR